MSIQTPQHTPHEEIWHQRQRFRPLLEQGNDLRASDVGRPDRGGGSNDPTVTSNHSSNRRSDAFRPVGGANAWKRSFDIVIAVSGLIVFAAPMAVVAVAVRATSRGNAIYWSNRVGRDNKLFRMPKFRSMRSDTPPVATHLLANTDAWLTPIGSFLRKSSLDELPQLWSILVGDMSLVGPRPALFNQDDLIALRTEHGVHRLRPGLTGWAQVNGRDELPIPEKVKFDVEYLHNQSLTMDLKTIWLTADKVLRAKDVSH